MRAAVQALTFVRQKPALYKMLGLMRFALFRAELARREWFYRRRPEIDGGLRLPPPRLRFRVGGSFGSATFLRIGGACASAIIAAARDAGCEIGACRKVLDFSCGCGRVLRHLPRGGPELHGADIDATAIDWCQTHLAPLATFTRTDFEPPLPYASGEFDLIYVVSLFTHIDERLQHLWLAELSRILAPGGLLIASLHGEFGQRDLPSADKERLATHGFVFQIGQTGRLKLDGLPDYYQAAYHSEAYVRNRWSRFLEPVLYRERGMNDDQDLVVLRKRS